MNNKNKDLPFVTESPKPSHIYLLPWNPNFLKWWGKFMLQGFIVLLAVVTFVLMAADPRDSGAQATQSAWQKTQAADMTKSQKNTNNDADFI